MTDKNTTLVPEEGWHCLHLFYRIEYGQWQLLSREEQNAAKTNLASLVQEVRAMESTQLLTLSMVTPKADLGFMLITPDLHNANKIEKRLALVRRRCADAGLQLSLAHRGKRIHHDATKNTRETLAKEQNLKPDSEKFAEAMHSFRERMKHYRQERVYPDAARLAGGLLL